MYSRRQKAREMLAGVALQLGCNYLDEVLRGIYSQCQNSAGCICSAVVDYVLRRVVYIDRGSIEQLTLQRTGTDRKPTMTELFETSGFPNRNLKLVLGDQKQQTDQDLDMVAIPQAVGPNTLKLIYQVLDNDLFNRAANDNQEKLAKLLEEFNFNTGMRIVETVCSTLNYKQLLEFIKRVLLQAIDHAVDVIALCERIVTGIRNNCQFGLKEVTGLIEYLTNEDKCFYCRRRPTAIMSVQDVRAQILNDEELTVDQKITKLRYGYQLLEKPPERDLAVTTQAIANQSYNENACVYITARLIQCGLEGKFGYVRFNEDPQLLAEALELVSTAHAREVQVQAYSAAEARLPIFQRAHYDGIFPYLDLCIYSNSAEVLLPAYCCSNKIMLEIFEADHRVCVSRHFVDQTLKQLYKTCDAELQRALYAFFLFFLRNFPKLPELKKYLDEKQLLQLLNTALLAIKSRRNTLHEPYQVLELLVEARFEHAAVYEAMEYMENQGINSFANTGLPAECRTTAARTLARFLGTYPMSSKLFGQKLQGLMKLAVDAELADTRELALEALRGTFPLLRPAQLANEEERLVLTLWAAHLGANGLEKARLREAACACLWALPTVENPLTKYIARFVQLPGRRGGQATLFLADLVRSEARDPARCAAAMERVCPTVLAGMRGALEASAEGADEMLSAGMRLLSAGGDANKAALRGLLVGSQVRLAGYPNLRVRDDFADALAALEVDFCTELEAPVAAALSDEFFGRRVKAMSVAELGAASGLLSQLLLAQTDDQCAGAFWALQEVIVLGYRE